jgi:hypothetical protein
MMKPCCARSYKAKNLSFVFLGPLWSGKVVDTDGTVLADPVAEALYKWDPRGSVGRCRECLCPLTFFGVDLVKRASARNAENREDTKR